MKKTNTNASLPGDETLLNLIENKTERGYTLLYERYWDHLVGYTFTIVQEKYIAEEIVQSLLISFYTRRIAIKNKFNLLPYLYKSIQNRIKNYYRSQHNYNKYIAYQKQDHIITTEMVISQLYLIDLQHEIKQCLGRLSEKCAEVFLLNKEYCLTIKEISRLLNRPESTVEKQLRKSLQFLRDNLNINLFTSN